MRSYLFGTITVMTLVAAIIVASVGVAVADGGPTPNASDNSSESPNSVFQVSILSPMEPNPFTQTMYTGKLRDVLPDDLDVFIYYNAGTANVTLEIEAEDCCLSGDTLWVKVLAKTSPGGSFTPVDTVRCTSPAAPCLISSPFPVGSIVLTVVGYLEAPSGFPAGYDITATAF